MENEALLALADLLISALSTLLPRTRTDTCSRTRPLPVACAETAAALPGLSEQVVLAFSLDRVWGRTAVMQRQSLCVLSMLLQSPLEVVIKEDHVTAMFAKLSTANKSGADVSDHKTAGGEDQDSGDNDNDEGVLSPLRGDVVLKHAHRILERTVASFASTASNPAALRREALVVATHVLDLAKQLSGRKLKSFAHWEKTVPEVDARTLACQLSVQVCLPNLLAGLDDSDDGVRIACLRALSTVAPLLLSDHSIASAEANPRTLLDACALCSVGNTIVRDGSVVAVKFDHVVSTLLKQATLPGVNDSAEFLDHLNDTLRVVCVLDPTVFEVIVRAELMPLLGDAASEVGTGMGKEQLSEFVSGLINHVAVLQQFNT